MKANRALAPLVALGRLPALAVGYLFNLIFVGKPRHLGSRDTEAHSGAGWGSDQMPTAGAYGNDGGGATNIHSGNA